MKTKCLPTPLSMLNVALHPETVWTIRGGEPRMAPSTFPQLPSSELLQVQCCFTSTETIQTIRGPGWPPLLSHISYSSPEPYSLSQCYFHFMQENHTPEMKLHSPFHFYLRKPLPLRVHKTTFLCHAATEPYLLKSPLLACSTWAANSNTVSLSHSIWPCNNSQPPINRFICWAKANLGQNKV